MSLRSTQYTWHLVVLFAGAALAGGSVAAEDDKADENRYELIKDGKNPLRFDKQTGELYRLERDENGNLLWVKVNARVSNAPATKARVPSPTAPEIQIEDSAHNQPEPKPKRKTSAPEIFDPEGNNLADLITDFDRRQSEPAILTYEKYLSVCNAVQIGDRISGTFLIKNKGDRKIKTLELTMFVPVIGREKPEEHRFLFTDKPGSSNPPPQPGLNGREPEALLQKVDIACPAGHTRGSADLKVTFIKFVE
ncbi:MAG TPA: hypothetical protein VEK08_12890 [Planctomycetota bacterium]|nr:hypothetical protein [Planctomycetota bacterium]